MCWSQETSVTASSRSFLRGRGILKSAYFAACSHSNVPARRSPQSLWVHWHSKIFSAGAYIMHRRAMRKLIQALLPGGVFMLDRMCCLAGYWPFRFRLSMCKVRKAQKETLKIGQVGPASHLCFDAHLGAASLEDNHEQEGTMYRCCREREHAGCGPHFCRPPGMSVRESHLFAGDSCSLTQHTPLNA